MKLLSSLLVATYANTVVDEKQCHEIDGLDQKYRKFEDKFADVSGLSLFRTGKHEQLEFEPAGTADLDDDGIPVCLSQCDVDEDCLFIVHTTDACYLGKVRADQTEVIFNR